MNDSIRIVPLHHPTNELYSDTDTAQTAQGNLTYRGGHLLAAVEVFTVFWGNVWNTQRAGLMNELNAFFDDILVSSVIDELAEYSVPGYQIGHGKRTGSLVVPTSPGAVTSDAKLRQMLQQEIASQGLPAPGANTLYFVYLPPGIRLTQGGSASCQAFCGYHSDIGGSLFYAAMPFPGCSGCRGPLPALAALTATSSHELCEAITDPVPGAGWYDDQNGEIGDICAWRTKTIGKWTVQMEWSDRTGSCI